MNFLSRIITRPNNTSAKEEVVQVIESMTSNVDKRFSTIRQQIKEGPENIEETQQKLEDKL